MKTRNFLIAMSVMFLAFASCSEDNVDSTSAVDSIVPQAAKSYIAATYPGSETAWSLENDMIKAKIKGDSNGTEVWFSRQGSWVYTEVDFKGTLPQAILDYIATYWSGYTVDDVDYITTSDDSYYAIELEHPTLPDVEIYIREDGTIVSHLNSPTDSSIPTSATEWITSKYGNVKVEWEYERGMLKAELTYQGQDIEVWFTTDGTWVATAIEYKSTLNSTIRQYLNTNYAGYEVDDVYDVTTTDDKYYYIELERKGYPDVDLKIREDGTVVSATSTSTDSSIPSAATAWITANYGSVKVEWEYERGMLKADFTYQNQDIDVWFTTDGTWVATAIEYEGILNTTIRQYLSTNYSGYAVDDVYYVTTTTDTYYYVELDRDGYPDVTVKIREDGTIVS